MKIKLAIIGAILVTGVVLFMPETLGLFPEAPIFIDSIKKDFGSVQNSTIEKVDSIEETLDQSIETVSNTVDDLKDTSTDLLSNTAASANETINQVLPFG